MRNEREMAQEKPVVMGNVGDVESCNASKLSLACLAGRYELLECLGRGSQGEVYRARQIADGAEVAIKVMHIQSVKNWKMYELFQREAKVLSAIDIEGVAKLYEAIEDLESADPVSVIVQQYIDGHALSELIGSHHRFLLSDIADILIQLTDILDKLHALNPPVIHRDIKPSNVMLEDSADGYKVWLIDFGAVANPQVKDGGSTVAGTYGYMAPEQLMGKPNPESDLYSMAVMAFYMLTGVPPESIEMQDFRLMIDPHLQHLPFVVTVLLRQMLEPHIEQRLTDTRIIRRAFELIKKSDMTGLESLIHTGRVVKDIDWTPMTSYKQAGCVEQWDALSDAVPRKIPREVMRKIEASLEYNPFEKPYDPTTQTTQRTDSAWDDNMIFYRRVDNRGRIAETSVSNVIATFIMAIPAGIGGIFLIQDAEFLLSMVFFGTFFLIVWAGIQLMKAPFKSSSRTLRVESVLRLLENGRKSFATVTSIEFMLYEGANLSNEYRPLWKVSYKFNPVDDASEEDLERFFYTRRRPSDLKVGDLIPCLYLIQSKGSSYERVYSIPWPILKYDDIYLSGDVAELLRVATDAAKVM